MYICNQGIGDLTRTYSEEGKNPIGRKGDGLRFTGSLCKIYIDYQDNALLYPIMGPICHQTAETPDPLGVVVFFHHDIVLAQTCAVATAKLMELYYELLPHILHSLDLGFLRILFVENLKKINRRKKVLSPPCKPSL